MVPAKCGSIEYLWTYALGKNEIGYLPECFKGFRCNMVTNELLFQSIKLINL